MLARNGDGRDDFIWYFEGIRDFVGGRLVGETDRFGVCLVKNTVIVGGLMATDVGFGV